MASRRSLGLNENHERHLVSSVSYAAQLLRDCQQILLDSEQPQVFSRYESRLTPPQRKITRDYLNRLQQQLVHFLDVFGIRPPPPNTDAVRGFVVAMMFLDDTFEEMRGSKMHGFGPVPPDAERVLDGAVAEMQTLIHEVERFLSGEPGEVLRGRLARLAEGHPVTNDLRTLARIIEDHGLVDLRAALTTLVDRALEQTFEVAMVGRVSSGKSSLLNAVIGTPVLPTGILPVTAFPTRVKRGTAPAMHVKFANGRSETLAAERVGEFVTETENPSNEKRLTRLLIEYPSDSLPEGVIFVDTPGLGSLASTGALQTFAYLPRCDHATFLLDATAPVVEEDLSLLAFLREAGITTSVLLSKADLLSAADLNQVQSYVARAIRNRLGADISPRPISAMPSHAALLRAWITEEVTPLGVRARTHREEALARKVAALRAHVADALKSRTAQRQSSVAPAESRRLRERLRDISARIDEVARDIRDLGMVRSQLVERTLAAATDNIVQILSRHEGLDEDAVRAALMRPAQALAESTASTLRDVATTAHEAISDLAKAIGGAPTLEIAGVEREIPLLDLPTVTTTFQPPMWARVTRFTLERWVAEKVRVEWSDIVDRAVGNYLEVLRGWGSERLAQIRREFDATSRPLVAQLVSPPTRSGTRSQNSATDEDLKWLVGAAQPAE